MAASSRSSARNLGELSDRHQGTSSPGPEMDLDFLEQEAIPAIFSSKVAGDEVRAWIMGCGAGESAYALAILLSEANIRRGDALRVSVFVTDVDAQAVAAARLGRCSTAIENHVSPDRLRQWFIPGEDGGYRVSKELRSTCMFSVHNFAADIPLSQMDIICCGDVLRELDAGLQDSAVVLLHFALRPGGYLFPFADECLTRHSSLFNPAPGAHGIFARLDANRRFLPTLPLSMRTALPVGRSSKEAGSSETEQEEENRVYWLKDELRSTKEQLRSTIDQLRAANRRLQFSNEEYQSLNEELKSTNEELRASQAELQTVNSELGAVNSELAHRIGELRKTNCDLKNFMKSTQICTIFLDLDLRIMRFTPALKQIYRVIESDVGRPITDIACELPYDSLQEDVMCVARTLMPVEREVVHPGTAVPYLVRVVPYRNADELIAGVVVTFVDISAVAKAEEALRRSEERFRLMAASVPAALFTADEHLSWTYINPRFGDFTGMPEKAALGAGWINAVHPDDRAELEGCLHQALQTHDSFEHEFRLSNMASGYRWYFLRAVATSDLAAAPGGWTGSLLDTHERRAAESRQRVLFSELQKRVKTILRTVRSLAGHARDGNRCVDDFYAHFDGRLNSLARIQALIARHTEGIDLEELISEEIFAQATDCEHRITLSGAELQVGERIGQAIGLAVHELATNAVKYGALSKRPGAVEVAWRMKENREGSHLHLSWSERTVPIIDTNPMRIGFGRDYLEQGLAIELDASTQLEFRPGGLYFSIEFPFADLHPAGGKQ